MTSAVPEVLKDHYLQQVVPELKKECGFTNIHQVPKLEKIVLNSRIKAEADKAYIEQLVKDMALITGQAPVVIKSKKSIANFKLRQGVPNGVKVTLRGNRMYQFLYRLINIVFPVILDFRGVSSHFDRNGNLTIGIKDHSVFPEIKTSSNRINIGLDIAIVTTAHDSKDALLLLKKLGMVFR